MFSVLLFVLYFIILLFCLFRIIKRNHIDLNFPQTTAFFSLKIVSGCIYGYIFLHSYGGDDTWNLFNDSVTEYQKMIHQPRIFFKDFLPYPAFAAAQDFWQGMAYYITNLEYWLMIKLLAVFNIFSRGNYYIDLLFFNFLVSAGPLLLFKLLLSYFPDRKRILLVLIFFIPSVTFWLSGIRAEGLLLLFIGLILFYTDQWFSRKKIFFFCWIIAGLLGFLIFRDQALFLFLPAYFCWTISRRAGSRAIYYYICVYVGCICIFFASILISPDRNLASTIATRQHGFFRLHGNTRFKLDTLQPSIPGSVRILPQAFANTFLRPYLWEARGLFQWLSALEVIGFWVLIIFSLLYPSPTRKEVLGHPLILCFVFYGASQILLIGYIVPFPGAIVRYKAIPEILLFIGIALSIKSGIFKL